MSFLVELECSNIFRFIFLNILNSLGGAKSYQNLQKSNRYKDFGCFVHEYRMPTIPVEKLERGLLYLKHNFFNVFLITLREHFFILEKLNVQTKHSVEFGNWNIVR